MESATAREVEGAAVGSTIILTKVIEDESTYSFKPGARGEVIRVDENGIVARFFNHGTNNNVSVRLKGDEYKIAMP